MFVSGNLELNSAKEVVLIKPRTLLCGITLLCMMASPSDAYEMSGVGTAAANTANSVASPITESKLVAHENILREVDRSLMGIAQYATAYMTASPVGEPESQDYFLNLAWDRSSKDFISQCRRIFRSHRSILRQARVNVSRCADGQLLVQSTDDLISKDELFCAALLDKKKTSLRELRKMLVSSYSAINSIVNELNRCEKIEGTRPRGYFRGSAQR
jgi:hypothetical protein